MHNKEWSDWLTRTPPTKQQTRQPTNPNNTQTVMKREWTHHPWEHHSMRDHTMNSCNDETTKKMTHDNMNPMNTGSMQEGHNEKTDSQNKSPNIQQRYIRPAIATPTNYCACNPPWQQHGHNMFILQYNLQSNSKCTRHIIHAMLEALGLNYNLSRTWGCKNPHNRTERMARKSLPWKIDVDEW